MGWWKPHRYLCPLTYVKVLPLTSLKVHIQKTFFLFVHACFPKAGSYSMGRKNHRAYLPGVEVNHDHEGGSSRMRLSHCTSGQLTPTMVSNVDHLNAQFLLVGDCVRAIPQIRNQAKWQSEDVGWFTLKTDIAKFLFVPGQRSCIWLHLLISPLTITKLSKRPSK